MHRQRFSLLGPSIAAWIGAAFIPAPADRGDIAVFTSVGRGNSKYAKRCSSVPESFGIVLFFSWPRDVHTALHAFAQQIPPSIYFDAPGLDITARFCKKCETYWIQRSGTTKPSRDIQSPIIQSKCSTGLDCRGRGGACTRLSNCTAQAVYHETLHHSAVVVPRLAFQH